MHQRNSVKPPFKEKSGGISLLLMLSTLLALMLVLAGGLLWGMNEQHRKQMDSKASAVAFERIGREMALHISALHTPVEQAVGLVARQQLAKDMTVAARMDDVPAVAEVMRSNAALSGFYVGYANGDYFMVRHLRRSMASILGLRIPAQAAFMVESIKIDADARRYVEFVFLGEDLKTLQTIVRPGFDFDPRKRGWYKDALASARSVRTDPYVFASSRLIGITIAQRSSMGSVVAADMPLSNLSTALSLLKVSPSAELVLIDKNAGVLAYYTPGMKDMPREGLQQIPPAILARLGEQKFPVFADNIRKGHFNTPIPININGDPWSARIVPVDFKGVPVFLAISIPDGELLSDASMPRYGAPIIIALLLLLMVPVISIVGWYVARPLRRLAQEAKAILHFDFSQRHRSRSPIREIDTLFRAMAETRSTLMHVIGLSSAWATEQDVDRLLERLVAETVSLAQAEVGMLYLFDSERRIAQPQTMQWQQDGTPVLPQELDVRLPANADNPVCQCLLSGATQTSVVRFAEGPYSGWLGSMPAHLAEEQYGLTAIALKNRQAETIGAVLLLGAVREAGSDTHWLAVLEALVGAVAVAMESVGPAKEADKRGRSGMSEASSGAEVPP
ncbi:hypothetical protein RGU70_16305 [Herbaspirillum sp. RTI4]|uniref:hypothetical protein n=1 Tax=Herbaspirillum sp. RTI4 TaxID=3048640 RepID=UPI002AB3FF6F|nr:hypothetical protein [Herbaspirillum sp. RTI4]MDY7579878.1 hypothetical protein [Herbaspirillum sp. RTI4]MEA9981965.1 hypothetical protein [Herbaspirillum sp. RTI4]